MVQYIPMIKEAKQQASLTGDRVAVEVNEDITVRVAEDSNVDDILDLIRAYKLLDRYLD